MDKSRSRTNKPIIVTLCVILCLMLLGGAFVRYQDSLYGRLRFTKMALTKNRGEIARYRDLHGSPPASLDSMLQGLRQQNPGDSTGTPILLKEVISTEEGMVDESAVLNGKGGWYYNSNTGELRVNLTKPLKTYFKYYYHRGRNETPSDW